MHHVFCTGNIGNAETLKKTKKISPNFLLVKGDQDLNPGIPEFKKITIKGVNFLIFHGHQILPWGDLNYIALLQKEYNADFIITGHTHEAFFKKIDRFYVLNPGSVTGVGGGVPSFALVKLGEREGMVYLYKCVEGKVEIDKIKFDFK